MSFIPLDYGYFVYFIFFYEGVGNLFPWNAFITASEYYSERFCGTAFHASFENYFSLTYTFSQVIGLALSIKYQNRYSIDDKIIWPLFCYSAIFATTTILVSQDIDAILLFWLTLFSAFLSGLCGAVLTGGLFGLSAVFPPAYTGAIMSGQGLAGLVVSLSSILTTASAPTAVDYCDDLVADDNCSRKISYSALAYFTLATLILLSCIVAFILLRHLPFARHFVAKGSSKPNLESDVTNPLFQKSRGGVGVKTHLYINAAVNDDEETSTTTTTTTTTAVAPVSLTGRAISNERKMFLSPKNVDQSETLLLFGSSADERDSRDSGERDINTTHSSPADSQQPSSSSSVSYETIWAVFWQLKVPALSVMFTFVVTIAIFPALVVSLQSTQRCKSSQRFYNDLFVPFLFLLYNLFDFSGRVLAGYLPCPFTAATSWVPSAARVVFVPLFLLCKVGSSQLPVVFNSDACSIVFMILFALSNGYVASCCMMLGAAEVTGRDSPLAGTIMVFCLTLGLCLGACSSFVVVYISQGSVVG